MTQVIKIDQNTVEIDGEVYVKKAVKKKERPKKGETYYYLSKEGYICRDDWEGYNCEYDMYRQGNIFRTESEAIHERERRNLMTDLRKFADFEPDWEDDDQRKYYPVYIPKSKKWAFESALATYLPNQVYFPSKVKQVFEKFSDRLKYLLPYEMQS